MACRSIGRAVRPLSLMTVVSPTATKVGSGKLSSQRLPRPVPGVHGGPILPQNVTSRDWKGRADPGPQLNILTLLLCESPEKMDPGPPRLQRRNVEVFDSDRAVIAGTVHPFHRLLCLPC